jgi:hypothetical protein
LTANATVSANFAYVDPPTITITAAPTNPSSDPHPVFRFSADETGMTFKCAVDNGPLFVCTSPVTLNVGNGIHIFSVQGTNSAGIVSNTAGYRWLVQGVVDPGSAIPTLNDAMLLLLAIALGCLGLLAVRDHDLHKAN